MYINLPPILVYATWYIAHHSPIPDAQVIFSYELCSMGLLTETLAPRLDSEW